MIFLILSLLITTISFSQSYYYDGKKIKLEENEEFYYIVFSDTAKLESSNLGKSFSINIKKVGTNVVSNTNRYWKLVEIGDNSKSKSLEAKSKILDMPNVLLDYPGNFDERILCIGAIDANGSRSDFSAYGSRLDVVAPGRNPAGRMERGTIKWDMVWWMQKRRC